MIRHALIFWISVILAIFGFVIGVLTEPFYTLSKLILPLVLLVIIYYAYKMGPGNTLAAVMDLESKSNLRRKP